MTQPIPDPEHAGWISNMLAIAGTALTALATWAWNHTHKRIDKVDADSISKDEFNRHLNDDAKTHVALMEELSVQRSHIGKIFDQMRTTDLRNDDRHVELLNAIHANGRK